MNMSHPTKNNILIPAAGLVCGSIFGLGLSISEMVNPAKVLGFLDILGDWDPSLAFVMGGALITAALSYRLIARRPAPSLMPAFHIPSAKTIDGSLIGGAALFGIGWGLVGLCPGPALANISLGLAFGGWKPVVFIMSMLSGMILHSMIRK